MSLSTNMPLIKLKFKRALRSHTKGRFPREFAFKLKNGKLVRNFIVRSVDDLVKYCEKRRFTDCYCSVYSFTDPDPKDGKQWDRSTIIFDEVFIDLDADTDLRISFKDAQKLVSYLLSLGIIPRLYFSGARGFHIHIDHPPITIENTSEVRTKLYQYFCERLGIKTIDLNVKDDARVCRIPLTYNSKTGFLCVPLDPKSFIKSDFVTFHCLKHRPYIPEVVEAKDFLNWLRETDIDISLNKFQKELERIRLMRKKGRMKGKKRAKKNKDIDRYISAMKKYGCFTEDPWIFKRHAKISEGNIKGRAEHNARVYFAARCIELGYNEEEILDVFRYASNFDERKSRYYIGKIKEMVERKHGK